MEPLLLRPAPLKGESLTSYVYRLARANHYPKPDWILDLAGISTQLNLDLVDWTVYRRLARHTLMSQEDIGRLTLFGFLQKPKHPLGEKAVPWKDLVDMSASCRLCPDCLRESNHLRLAWLLKPVTACPVHRKTLVARCSCGARLTKAQCLDNRCSCGRRVDSLGGAPIPNDGEALSYLSFLSMSTGLGNLQPFAHDFVDEQRTPFDLLASLEGAARLLMSISVPQVRDALLKPYIRPSGAFSRQPDYTKFGIYARACLLLQDWPKSFQELLRFRETVGSRQPFWNWRDYWIRRLMKLPLKPQRSSFGQLSVRKLCLESGLSVPEVNELVATGRLATSSFSRPVTISLVSSGLVDQHDYEAFSRSTYGDRRLLSRANYHQLRLALAHCERLGCGPSFAGFREVIVTVTGSRPSPLSR